MTIPRAVLIFILLAAAVAVGGSCAHSGEWVAPPQRVVAPDDYCRAELKSWVVAGRGRHMFLEIDCPSNHDDLDGIVEFANTAMRSDFDWTLDPGGAARIARMEKGIRVLPALGPPEDRLEETFLLPPATARCLQRDRLYEKPYFILGPNSNSAMRAACEACEVPLPKHVTGGAGVLGEFPGVNFSPGEEIPAERWTEFGWRLIAP